MDRLTHDADVEARALEEGRRAARELQRRGLALALVGHLVVLGRGVVRVDCAVSRRGQRVRECSFQRVKD